MLCMQKTNLVVKVFEHKVAIKQKVYTCLTLPHQTYNMFNTYVSIKYGNG